MANQESTLTAANIRYLLALYEFDRDNAGVRSTNIAERVGVTKPSVHTMLKTLCGKKYAVKEKYGMVHLTPLGRQLAEKYAECFELLRNKIQTALKLPLNDCSNAACAILAQTDERSLGALSENLHDKHID